MGKPYRTELQKMTFTYKWALTTEIDELTEFINASRSLPLIAVGSGGSLSAAIFTSILHQQTGMISQYLTPLELVSSLYDWHRKSIILLTAKGGNSDILTSIKMAINKEPRQLMVLCAKKESTIGRFAREYSFINLCELEPPSGKNGFLSTNSLLVFLISLIRAYRDCFSLSYELPESFENIIHPNNSQQEFLRLLKNDLQPLLDKDTLVVLYGKWGKPASFDLESKFTEAALGNTQLADYRNFAHGRHYWLEKRSCDSGIISLITPEDQPLAERILKLIPEDIPTVRIDSIFHGPVGAISLLVKIMYLVGIFGDFNSIDPGRPKVPEFGRKLYHLKIPPKMILKNQNPLVRDLYPFVIRAIRKKISTPINLITDKKIINFWVDSYNRFVYKIEKNNYSAVIFDYDGTLCESREQFIGASEYIGRQLAMLLDNGIFVGIATGRGKSVRKDLQRIIPRKHWSRVLIGYYNGSDTGLLSDCAKPVKDKNMKTALNLLMNYLKEVEYLDYISTYECRPNQITFTPRNSASMIEIKSILQNISHKNDLTEIQILESGHSIDVLAPKVNKLNVLIELKKHFLNHGGDDPILCIGDKGRWPGNDFYLLSTRYSLSVDTASSDPDTCWNLAPDGHRGIQATLDYLRTMECRDEQIVVNLRPLRGG